MCSISVLPDLGNTSPQCASQFTLMSFVKALLPFKNQMLLDTQLNCQRTQNCINVLLGGTDSYQSCVVDINVETETSHDEVVGNVKSESVVSSCCLTLLSIYFHVQNSVSSISLFQHTQKVLQRQASLTTGKIWHSTPLCGCLRNTKIICLCCLMQHFW